jgi:hypothetical protein
MSDSIVSGHTEGASGAAAILVAPNSTLTFHNGLLASNNNHINESSDPIAPGTIINLSSMAKTTSAAGYMAPGSPHYNYHLRNTSLAKDQATGSSTNDDYDLQTRPFNGISDYGADEYLPFPLFVRIGDGALQLDWSQDLGFLSGAVSSYEVIVTDCSGASPDQGSCGVPIGVGSATHFTLTGLSNFNEYTLTVYAKAGSNQIAESYSVSATPMDRQVFLPYINN